MDHAARPGFWSYACITCLTLWIGCFAVLCGIAIPQFATLFAGFGTDLPALTKWIIEQRMTVWVLLLLGFFAQVGFIVILLMKRSFAARRLALISSGINVLAELILIAAMYGPIFKLGAVV